jgi:hypothetical protein
MLALPIIFGFFILALPTGALAAPEIFAPQYYDQTIVFSKTTEGYEANQIISTDWPLHVKLDRKPVKIEMRAVYQGAVGDDGPWLDVPGAWQKNEWTTLPAQQEFDVTSPDDKTESTMTWPEKFDCAKSDVAKQPDECARWTEIYKKCHQQGENGPCYTYLSTFELRVVYEQGATPEIIRINFAGGC